MMLRASVDYHTKATSAGEAAGRQAYRSPVQDRPVRAGPRFAVTSARSFTSVLYTDSPVEGTS